MRSTHFLLTLLASPSLCYSMLPAAEKPAAPAETKAAAAAEEGQALFNGKDLTGWEAVDCGGSGEAVFENGSLILKPGESLTGVVYKLADKLPVTNYEITLEARRLEGSDFFCGLTFPVNDIKTCATLVLGGWGGSVTGISCIDGADASENSTGSSFSFENKRWYKVRMVVTPKLMEAFVDGKSIASQELEDHKISLRHGPIQQYAPFSLTTYQTKGEIRNVRVKKIK